MENTINMIEFGPLIDRSLLRFEMYLDNILVHYHIFKLWKLLFQFSVKQVFQVLIFLCPV